MRRPVETLASGLGHPEGPDVLPDGRIVLVEGYTGKVLAWSPERGVHDYAVCGGGPNSCLVGSDGAVYITQNGGTAGAWKAEVRTTPAIQRAWPDGRVETVTSEVDGIALQAPNDLTFGPDGLLYFTDPGEFDASNRSVGRLFALHPDGAGELLEEVGPAYPNGIAAEPDGSLIWVDSYDRGVYRKRPGRASEKIHVLPEGRLPDGVKIDENGNLWIATFMSRGVDIVASDGTPVDFLETGGLPCNCVFVDDSLIVVDLGDLTEVPAETVMAGRLWRIRVDVRGMPVFRGAVA